MRHSEQMHCRGSHQCTKTEKCYRQRKRQQDQSDDFPARQGDCSHVHHCTQNTGGCLLFLLRLAQLAQTFVYALSRLIASSLTRRRVRREVADIEHRPRRYLIAVQTVENVVFNCVPILSTAVRIAIEMVAATSAYSMAVAPDSSRRNRVIDTPMKRSCMNLPSQVACPQ
jgi:hypothetical protein